MNEDKKETSPETEETEAKEEEVQVEEKEEKKPEKPEKKEKKFGRKKDEERAALEAEKEALEKEKAALNDKYLRICAEYDNFRRRSQKEKDNLYGDIKADTVQKFLPVYDNLERALKQGTEDKRLGRELVQAFRNGIGFQRRAAKNASAHRFDRFRQIRLLQAGAEIERR